MESKVDKKELGWDKTFIHHKLQRSKGKCKYVWARQMDVCLQPMAKSARIGMEGTARGSTSTGSHQKSVHIWHDIWFHIAMRIEPEDVQRFALICKQTAYLVNTYSFWWSLYRRYCKACSGWNLELPGHLQMEEIRSSSKNDSKALRSLVIKALFHCHQQLKIRIDLGYSLDWTRQRICVSCWQKRYQCFWIMCYKFCNKHNRQPQHQTEEGLEVIKDWEQLANDIGAISLASHPNYREGVVLLIVICNQFIPIASELSCGLQESRYRLIATRELLCTDMRHINLELDFAEGTSRNSCITVKYPRIKKYKVLPWWHPDFHRFIK